MGLLRERMGMSLERRRVVTAPAGITQPQADRLTLAAIRAIAARSPESPLRDYVLSLTDDLDLPERGA